MKKIILLLLLVFVVIAAFRKKDITIKGNVKDEKGNTVTCNYTGRKCYNNFECKWQLQHNN